MDLWGHSGQRFLQRPLVAGLGARNSVGFDSPTLCQSRWFGFEPQLLSVAIPDLREDVKASTCHHSPEGQ